MNIKKFIMSIAITLVCQQVVAGKFTTFLEGSPGAQAKASRAMAQMNIINPGKDDHVGCNQEIGNVQQGNGPGIKEQTIVIKGDVINVCK